MFVLGSTNPLESNFKENGRLQENLQIEPPRTTVVICSNRARQKKKILSPARARTRVGAEERDAREGRSTMRWGWKQKREMRKERPRKQGDAPRNESEHLSPR